MSKSFRVIEALSPSPTDLALQALAIDVGASVARLSSDAGKAKSHLGQVVDDLTTSAWLSAADPIVAGGSHVVYEVARTASGRSGGGQTLPCSKECSEGKRRFCDTLATTLLTNGAEAARLCLDDFAERIRCVESLRHTAILHFATYLCLGFEDQAQSDTASEAK